MDGGNRCRHAQGGPRRGRARRARCPARQPRDRDDGCGLPEPACPGRRSSGCPPSRSRARAVTARGLFASSSVPGSASSSASVRAARSARRGKSDLIDAALAARRLLSGERLSLPRGGGRREDLRLLLLERRGAMQARNAALNQLSALLVTAPDHVRERLGALSGDRLARAAARLRPSSEVMNGVLRRLGRRVERLSSEVAEAERALAALVAEVAPALLEECGVGPVCGAQLLVSSGDPSRMRSEASFAALAGTSPVDASSGKQRRHRLNRGGDRQLNWALHVVALATDPPPRRDRRLLPAATRRRQDHQGGTPLRQARARPPLLPTPARAADAPLDNIEASASPQREAPRNTAKCCGGDAPVMPAERPVYQPSAGDAAPRLRHPGHEYRAPACANRLSLRRTCCRLSGLRDMCRPDLRHTLGAASSDPFGQALGDRNGGQVCVGTRDRRHDRRVGDEQALDS